MFRPLQLVVTQLLAQDRDDTLSLKFEVMTIKSSLCISLAYLLPLVSLVTPLASPVTPLSALMVRNSLSGHLAQLLTLVGRQWYLLLIGV